MRLWPSFCWFQKRSQTPTPYFYIGHRSDMFYAALNVARVGGNGSDDAVSILRRLCCCRGCCHQEFVW
jgi:hypothetical protein